MLRRTVDSLIESAVSISAVLASFSGIRTKDLLLRLTVPSGFDTVGATSCTTASDRQSGIQTSSPSYRSGRSQTPYVECQNSFSDSSLSPLPVLVATADLGLSAFAALW